MVLDGPDRGCRQGRQRCQGDELAVIVVSTGSTRDLRQLGILQIAQLAPVELAQIREVHAIDVHVEAHADGVGGNHVVDLARLVERDLGIAHPR